MARNEEQMNQPEREVQRIEAQLEAIDQRLDNARKYLAKNVNVRSKSNLHFEDWRGNSGHPLWMKNFMIPATTRGRARKAKALRDIEDKAKDKRLTLRKRHASTPSEEATGEPGT
jgi:hypothetical protein